MTEGAADSDTLEFYLKFAKPLVLNLPDPNQRVLAAAWVKKLRDEASGTENVRKEYLKLLLFTLNRKRLAGMFSAVPNDEPLKEIERANEVLELAKEIILEEERERVKRMQSGLAGGDYPPYTAECSADLLEYAAAQDIPKFGVHAYYALSLDPITQWDQAENGILPKGVVLETSETPEKDTSVPGPVPDGSLVKSPKKPKTPKSAKKSPSPAEKSITPPSKDLSGTPKLPEFVKRSPEKKSTPSPYGLQPLEDPRSPITWGSNLISVMDRPSSSSSSASSSMTDKEDSFWKSAGSEMSLSIPENIAKLLEENAPLMKLPSPEKPARKKTAPKKPPPPAEPEAPDRPYNWDEAPSLPYLTPPRPYNWDEAPSLPYLTPPRPGDGGDEDIVDTASRSQDVRDILEEVNASLLQAREQEKKQEQEQETSYDKYDKYKRKDMPPTPPVFSRHRRVREGPGADQVYGPEEFGLTGEEAWAPAAGFAFEKQPAGTTPTKPKRRDYQKPPSKPVEEVFPGVKGRDDWGEVFFDAQASDLIDEETLFTESDRYEDVEVPTVDLDQRLKEIIRNLTEDSKDTPAASGVAATTPNAGVSPLRIRTFGENYPLLDVELLEYDSPPGSPASPAKKSPQKVSPTKESPGKKKTPSPAKDTNIDNFGLPNLEFEKPPAPAKAPTPAKAPSPTKAQSPEKKPDCGKKSQIKNIDELQAVIDSQYAKLYDVLIADEPQPDPSSAKSPAQVAAESAAKVAATSPRQTAAAAAAAVAARSPARAAAQSPGQAGAAATSSRRTPQGAAALSPSQQVVTPPLGSPSAFVSNMDLNWKTPPHTIPKFVSPPSPYSLLDQPIEHAMLTTEVIPEDMSELQFTPPSPPPKITYEEYMEYIEPYLQQDEGLDFDFDEDAVSMGPMIEAHELAPYRERDYLTLVIKGKQKKFPVSARKARRVNIENVSEEPEMVYLPEIDAYTPPRMEYVPRVELTPEKPPTPIPPAPKKKEPQPKASSSGTSMGKKGKGKGKKEVLPRYMRPSRARLAAAEQRAKEKAEEEEKAKQLQKKASASSTRGGKGAKGLKGKKGAATAKPQEPPPREKTPPPPPPVEATPAAVEEAKASERSALAAALVNRDISDVKRKFLERVDNEKLQSVLLRVIDITDDMEGGDEYLAYEDDEDSEFPEGAMDVSALTPPQNITDIEHLERGFSGTPPKPVITPPQEIPSFDLQGAPSDFGIAPQYDTYVLPHKRPGYVPPPVEVGALPRKITPPQKDVFGKIVQSPPRPFKFIPKKQEVSPVELVGEDDINLGGSFEINEPSPPPPAPYVDPYPHILFPTSPEPPPQLPIRPTILTPPSPPTPTFQRFQEEFQRIPPIPYINEDNRKIRKGAGKLVSLPRHAGREAAPDLRDIREAPDFYDDEQLEFTQRVQRADELYPWASERRPIYVKQGRDVNTLSDSLAPQLPDVVEEVENIPTPRYYRTIPTRERGVRAKRIDFGQPKPTTSPDPPKKPWLVVVPFEEGAPLPERPVSPPRPARSPRNVSPINPEILALESRLRGTPSPPGQYPEELMGVAAALPKTYERRHLMDIRAMPDKLPTPLKSQYEVQGWKTPEKLKTPSKPAPPPPKFTDDFTNFMAYEQAPREYLLLPQNQIELEEEMEEPLTTGLPFFTSRPQRVSPGQSPSASSMGDESVKKKTTITKTTSPERTVETRVVETIRTQASSPRIPEELRRRSPGTPPGPPPVPPPARSPSPRTPVEQMLPSYERRASPEPQPQPSPPTIIDAAPPPGVAFDLGAEGMPPLEMLPADSPPTSPDMPTFMANVAKSSFKVTRNKLKDRRGEDLTRKSKAPDLATTVETIGEDASGNYFYWPGRFEPHLAADTRQVQPLNYQYSEIDNVETYVPPRIFNAPRRPDPRLPISARVEQLVEHVEAPEDIVYPVQEPHVPIEFELPETALPQATINLDEVVMEYPDDNIYMSPEPEWSIPEELLRQTYTPQTTPPPHIPLELRRRSPGTPPGPPPRRASPDDNIYMSPKPEWSIPEELLRQTYTPQTTPPPHIPLELRRRSPGTPPGPPPRRASPESPWEIPSELRRQTFTPTGTPPFRAEQFQGAVLEDSPVELPQSPEIVEERVEVIEEDPREFDKALFMAEANVLSRDFKPHKKEKFKVITQTRGMRALPEYREPPVSVQAVAPQQAQRVSPQARSPPKPKTPEPMFRLESPPPPEVPSYERYERFVPAQVAVGESSKDEIGSRFQEIAHVNADDAFLLGEQQMLVEPYDEVLADQFDVLAVDADEGVLDIDAAPIEELPNVEQIEVDPFVARVERHQYTPAFYDEEREYQKSKKVHVGRRDFYIPRYAPRPTVEDIPEVQDSPIYQSRLKPSIYPSVPPGSATISYSPQVLESPMRFEPRVPYKVGVTSTALTPGMQDYYEKLHEPRPPLTRRRLTYTPSPPSPETQQRTTITSSRSPGRTVETKVVETIQSSGSISGDSRRTSPYIPEELRRRSPGTPPGPPPGMQQQVRKTPPGTSPYIPEELRRRSPGTPPGPPPGMPQQVRRTPPGTSPYIPEELRRRSPGTPPGPPPGMPQQVRRASPGIQEGQKTTITSTISPGRTVETKVVETIQSSGSIPGDSRMTSPYIPDELRRRSPGTPPGPPPQQARRVSPGTSPYIPDELRRRSPGTPPGPPPQQARRVTPSPKPPQQQQKTPEDILSISGFSEKFGYSPRTTPEMYVQQVHEDEVVYDGDMAVFERSVHYQQEVPAEEAAIALQSNTSGSPEYYNYEMFGGNMEQEVFDTSDIPDDSFYSARDRNDAFDWVG